MIKRTMGALLALVLAGALAGCASTDSADKSAQKAPPPAGEIAVAPESILSDWNFAAKPTNQVTDAYAKLAADVAVPAAQGDSGAKLIIKADSEAKYLTEDGATFLAFNRKDSSAVNAEAKNFKATFEVTLEDAGTIIAVVSGNGDAAPSRVVVIRNAAGENVAEVDNLAKTPVKTLTAANLPAGTYTILVGGARLHRIVVAK